MVWWNPGTWGKLNADAIALKANLHKYVNSYINVRNKNNKNAIPPLNAKIINALKRYINSKRPKVAGAVAAAVNNAGGTNKNAAAAAVSVSNSNISTPSAAANAAIKPLLANGAPPVQVAAAAASAAQAQAQAQRQGPVAAQQAGAEAAARAARQALPNATPAQQAQTAANGAVAANVNAKRAALAALLNGVTNNNITSPNGKSIAEIEKLKANLEALNINNNRKTAVLRLINTRLRTNVAEGTAGSGSANINALRGAVSQNTNVMNKAQAAEELRRLKVLLSKVGQVNNTNLKSKINNYRRLLNAKVNPVSSGETGAPAPLELNINVPGENRKVKVRRNNPGANWNFVNNANKSRYNLNNRNKNVPKIRNISAAELFKQGN
jgi:hypothetical protein